MSVMLVVYMAIELGWGGGTTSDYERTQSASQGCLPLGVMSETVTSQTSDYVAHQRAIRALELKLEKLEYGLAMPRDEYAIAETKALLEHIRGIAMTDRP